MNWTEQQIKYIISDMIEDNPIACRALFQVSKIEFTKKVSTMAVSLSAAPILYINLEFCKKYLTNENDVKAVLLHEFLHVLLLHTVKYKNSSPLLNICLDAIINAIIYRHQGEEYSDLFVRFYKWEKLSFLLRPQGDENPLEKDWMDIHSKIYSGRYCGDDLYELLEYLGSKVEFGSYENIVLLGNHNHNVESVSVEVNDIIKKTLEKMNGIGIWRKNAYGSGSQIDKKISEIEKNNLREWNQATLKVLKKVLTRDEQRVQKLEEYSIYTPVITGKDVRSLSKFIWSGLIPFSNHTTRNYQMYPSERAHVYFDVSGSMDEEINRLTYLLFNFKKYIKRPLWVFSDDVKEALFIKGKLIYETSYGTSIDVVFDHIRRSNISKAMIVTDGYTDRITEETLAGIDKSKIHVLLSNNGNAAEFEKMNISYSRLTIIK